MTLDLGANDVCQRALWSIIAILMIRELTQMLTSENKCKHYFCEPENWIDWIVIFFTIFYLINLQSDENDGGKNQWTINLGALAVLSGKY